MEEEKNIKNNHKKYHHHHHHHKPSNPNAVKNEPKENSGEPRENNGAKNNGENRYQGNRNKRHHHRYHNDHRKNNPTQQESAQKPVETTEEKLPVTEEIEAVEAVAEEVAVVEEKAEDTEAAQKSEVLVDVVGIRFKSSGKTYYFDPAGHKLTKGAYAIVDTARGLEYGEVSLANTQVSESDIVPPLRAVIRIATEADKEHHLENKKKEEQAFVTCNERILAHKLDMKLIEAQYTFDNTKLLFYFTSSGRVDFRELVKDLASVFKTRIELRQIGIRDEAKLIGGLGLCGRPLCCSVFLSDFGQVSIKMAKEQNLSLNSAKISGACGRLMCCLRYEHETYDYEIKRTPPVDSTVKTDDGIGTVTEISPLAGTLKVRLADKPDIPPKTYHRDNVKVIEK